jgi:hypothetical protein
MTDKIITLANLHEATKQDIFNQVARHLITQNHRSVDEKGYCKYRSGNLKCAAGCLISDEEYTPLMDSEKSQGTGWIDLVHEGLVPRDNMHFIRLLQVLHDGMHGITSPEEWFREVQYFAFKHDLTMPTATL